MAQCNQQNVRCAVCQDVFKDPVTIPCGHNYCMSCIKSHFDAQDQTSTYTCPQCRKIFIPRPVLVKNAMLAVLKEELKETVRQDAPGDHHYAGPGDVACDVCMGRKLKALKSCLTCLVSYCEQHLQPHYTSAFENHRLVDPSKNLKQNICSRHKAVKNIFCRTDQKCICYQCFMDEHRNHKTVSAEAERTERQKELDANLKTIQQKIQTREEDVKLLQQEEQVINQSTDKAVEDIEKNFTELIRLIKEKSADIKRQIKSQQKSEVSRVKELRRKLDQGINELKKTEAELKQFSHTEDHTEFLLSYSQQPKLSESTDSPSIKPRSLRYFNDVMAAVTETRDKLQDTIDEECHKLSQTVKSVDVLLVKAEPKTRDEFLQFSNQIKLDPNTVHKQLCVVDKDRKVGERALMSSDPDRFKKKQQVLSRNSLTRICYWEVEWSGRGVTVAVVYKNIHEEDVNGFGNTNRSWALDCYKNSYKFRHNSVTTHISGPPSPRVGVFLDHSAGFLCFYSVSDTMTLLHRVQTRFTEPLYAGIWIWSRYWETTTARFIDKE